MRKIQAFFTTHHQEERDPLNIPPATLNSLMCAFLLNVRKDLPANADIDKMAPEKVYHQPETLTSFYTGLAR